MTNPPEDSIRTIYIGDIVTMDKENTVAEALVVSGDRIVFVGGLSAGQDAAGPDARTIELGSRALLPGFVDGHGHIGLETMFSRYVSLDPPPVGSVENIGDLQAILSNSLKEGALIDGWLFGRNYDDSMLAERRHPTRDDLDEVSADVPIAIVHASGHLGVVNSKALAELGFDASSVDPEGGVICRREGSLEPNGVLQERAWIDETIPRLPTTTPEQAMEDLVVAQELYVSNGWTTVQDGATFPPLMELFRAANNESLFKIDVVVYPKEPGAHEQIKDLQPTDGYVGRVRVGGVKIVGDGSPQGRTAWLAEPYYQVPEGQPDTYRGFPAFADEEMNSMVEKSHALGWPVLVHCNGDATMDQFINAASLARGEGGSGDDRDFVVIHAQTARDDQLDTMKRIGMMPSFFVSHVFFWGDWHHDVVLGPDRGSRISPTGSAVDRGMRFTTHNDTPILPPWSMSLVWCAAARQTRSGRVLGGDQRISVEQALRAITIDAAYQYSEEAEKGSLEKNKLADLVVLSANPYKIDAEDLRDIKILKTVSRGKTVYSA